MEEKTQIVVSILNTILGNPKRSGNLQEFEFNCNSKVCRLDKEKYNLSYNSKSNKFHCWKCKYGGSINRLIEDFGNSEDIKKINYILPQEKSFKKEIKKDFDFNDMIVCKLPEDFKPLNVPNNSSRHYKAAVKYVVETRKISWDIINKYNIGYTEDIGNRKYRIIIPSYNSFGKINYYVARSYYESVKPNYMAPPKEEVARTEIIFNLKNVNFDLPVILVEGAFDMFHLYNVIPMLGKEPSKLILNKLKEYGSRVILCLDEDALFDTVKLYNLLTSYGLEVFYVEVKDDIDEFVKKNGKDAMVNLMKSCQNLYLQNAFKKLCDKEKENPREYVEENEIKKEFELIKQETNNYESRD